MDLEERNINFKITDCIKARQLENQILNLNNIIINKYESHLEDNRTEKSIIELEKAKNAEISINNKVDTTDKICGINLLCSGGRKNNNKKEETNCILI